MDPFQKVDYTLQRLKRKWKVLNLQHFGPFYRVVLKFWILHLAAVVQVGNLVTFLFEVALVFMLSIYRQRLLIMETLVEEIIMRYRFCHLHDDVMRIMSCLSHRLGRNIEQYNEPYPGIQGCNCILPIKLITVTSNVAKLLCTSYDLWGKIPLKLLYYWITIPRIKSSMYFLGFIQGYVKTSYSLSLLRNCSI